MSYVGSLDQGTSSTRFILFDEYGVIVSSHQIDLVSIFPFEGWVEQDPREMIQAAYICINKVCQGINGKNIKAIGITNARETTIVWDKYTGKPLYNAIVWLDTRTKNTCEEISAKLGSRDALRESCGLPISTYFSAMKIKWMMDNVKEVKQAVEDKRAMFGTVDTWLLWNFTGGINGGVHCTDVTNASRTMLLNLKTRQWDEQTCSLLNIPTHILPTVRSSAEIFGCFTDGPLNGIPIAGILGDQQAALVGQLCFQKGDAKNTYGTGCFMLLNTGTDIVHSTKGLLTTIGFQLGPKAPVYYALEGGVAIAGAAISWLKNQIHLISSPKDMELYARKVPDNGGVYFVPAFSGLFAPYWREDARGVIVGLTQFSSKSHLIRAVFEATCFQTHDVVKAMIQDSKSPITILKVDGGMTSSPDPLFLEMQADISNITVEKNSNTEATALGAAIAAGLAVGFWKSTADVHLKIKSATTSKVYHPKMDPIKRQVILKGWDKAVQKSLNWIETKDELTSKL